MGKKEPARVPQIQGSERRSSIRVRSRLPCQIERIEEDDIEALEARILDLAVIESDGVMHDAVDWRDHTDDLSREMVFMLNEVRALRQQVTEIQRVIEHYNETALTRRWIELNNQGLWLSASEDEEESWETGTYAVIRIQIPSIQTPEVLAVGRVLRIDEDDEREGTVFEFCRISQPHKQAISSYALRRERQMARSVRRDVDFD